MDRTPPDQWLSAKPEDYAACAADLTERLGSLGEAQLSDKQRQQLDNADPLMGGDVGAMLSQRLRGFTWLADGTQIKADDMEDAVALRGVAFSLEDQVSGLLQGTRDGIVVVAALALIVFEEAQKWVAAQPQDDEVAALGTALSGAHHALEESEARVTAHTQRTSKRVKGIVADGQAQKDQAGYMDTMDKLQKDEEVKVEDLQAAKQYKDRVAAEQGRRVVAAVQDQAAAKKKDKRGAPRT